MINDCRFFLIDEVLTGLVVVIYKSRSDAIL